MTEARSLGEVHAPAQPPDAGPRRTTRDDLVAWARANLRHRKLVVVSNREPYSHVRDQGVVRWQRNAGGLTVALDSVTQALGGRWIAYGSGNADRAMADKYDRVRCPPDQPSYTLRRIWLSREDYALYYSGLANGALWPLCHVAYVRPRFRLDEWQRYRDVNRRFAEAVLDEIRDEPALIFVQDYHLGLVARYLKEQRPDLEVAMFWHIPWPNPEIFRIFPWKQELLEGMLANDMVGFHIRNHAQNFLDSIASELEARVDRERLAVERGGKRTWVRHFPISVNAGEIAAMAESAETREAVRRHRDALELENCTIGLGVDRMDYTKGIPERLEALERMLEKYPEWIGRLCFIQIGVPSRIELKEYRDVMNRTRALAERINLRFPRRPLAPSLDRAVVPDADGEHRHENGILPPRARTVHLIETNLDFRDLVPFYRMADLCAVTSLHDGMNLVAKEYLAATSDLDGALVLSPFTGAARELERTWLASPYDREAMADAYHAALSEPLEARSERMKALRESVLRRNIFDWAIEVFDTLERLTLRMPQGEPSETSRDATDARG
jgi:trehalose 6-phosphate synthase